MIWDVSLGVVEDRAAESDLVSDVLFYTISCLIAKRDIPAVKRWGEALSAVKLKSASIAHLYMKLGRDTVDIGDKLSFAITAAAMGNQEAKRMAQAGLLERLRFVNSIRF